MALFNFLKNVGKVSADNAETGAIKLTAAVLGDDAMAEVAIKQKQDEHDQVIRQLADAKTEWKREQDEYLAEQAIHDRFMNEAETISALLQNPDGHNVDELNADLNFILTKLEEHAPKLEKEKREADEAKVWLDEVQGYVDEISAQLLALRETLNQSKQAIKQAELDSERAAKKAKQAEVLAGLSSATNKYDIAVNAMADKAAKLQKEAETNRLKAASLTKPKLDDGSSVLGKYTKAAPAPVSTESLQDRLARLKS